MSKPHPRFPSFKFLFLTRGQLRPRPSSPVLPPVFGLAGSQRKLLRQHFVLLEQRTRTSTFSTSVETTFLETILHSHHYNSIMMASQASFGIIDVRRQLASYAERRRPAANMRGIIQVIPSAATICYTHVRYIYIYIEEQANKDKCLNIDVNEWHAYKVVVIALLGCCRRSELFDS